MRERGVAATAATSLIAGTSNGNSLLITPAIVDQREVLTVEQQGERRVSSQRVVGPHDRHLPVKVLCPQLVELEVVWSTITCRMCEAKQAPITRSRGAAPVTNRTPWTTPPICTGSQPTAHNVRCQQCGVGVDLLATTSLSGGHSELMMSTTASTGNAGSHTRVDPQTTRHVTQQRTVIGGTARVAVSRRRQTGPFPQPPPTAHAASFIKQRQGRVAGLS